MDMDKVCCFSFQKPPALERIEQIFKRLYLEERPGEESAIPEEDRVKIRSYLTGTVSLSGEYRRSGKGRSVRQEDLHLSAFLETGTASSDNDLSGISVSIHPNYCPPNRHDHTFFEIVCVISGRCQNTSGSEQLALEEGDILILAPGTRHSLSVFTEDAFVLNIFVSPTVFEKTFFPLLAEQDILPRRKEGGSNARWIVLDYAHVIVHIFHPEERQYYNIERLWQDGSNQLPFSPIDQPED